MKSQFQFIWEVQNMKCNVNNLISIESGLSVGSYDLAHIQGTITLKKDEKGEGAGRFSKICGHSEY